MRFTQARNYTRATGRKVDVVVIHTMESPEGVDTAESVASWFAGSTAPQASAHYCVDSNSIVQCVREEDVAWAAPGANSDGIHVEHAGRANQTAAQWADAYSRKELDVSAGLVADITRRHGIPARWLSVADLKAGRRGITSHANVSLAFRKSNHTDPGPGFPSGAYVALVAKKRKPVARVIRYVVKRRTFHNSGIRSDITTVEPG